MIKKSNLLFLIGLLISTSAVAQKENSDWIPITEIEGLSWEGQKGSGFVSTFNGKPKSSVSYVLQKTNKKNNSYTYEKVFVEIESCKRGYGFVYYNTMEGEYKRRDQFVRFGPTVADSIGSEACKVAQGYSVIPPMANNKDTWKVVATAEKVGDTISLKADTVRNKTYKKNKVVSALKRYYASADGKFYYTELIYSVAGCKNGVGTAYELDFDGNLINKSDVALKGNSIISATVNSMCSMSGS